MYWQDPLLSAALSFPDRRYQHQVKNLILLINKVICNYKTEIMAIDQFLVVGNALSRSQFTNGSGYRYDSFSPIGLNAGYRFRDIINKNVENKTHVVVMKQTDVIETPQPKRKFLSMP